VNRFAVMYGVVAFYSPLFAATKPSADERFFDRRVAPILIKHCLGCHNEELKNGAISFLDRDSLLKGGGRGPAIVPGKPERSLLVKALWHDSDIQMPPGPKLPRKEIAILTEWIQRGAVWGTKLKREAAL
jgi:hypothetical protein